VIAVQVAFVLLGMANILSVVAPAVLSRDILDRLGEAAAPQAGPHLGGAHAGAHLSAPTGQFIQVFSFDELAAVVRKTPGLEGFAIYSNEGLVVWRDLPIRLDLDGLVARLVSGAAGLGKVASGAGLGGLQRLLLESGQHCIYAAPVGENFGVVLVGRDSASSPDLHGRTSVVLSTVREFLRWKYPSLPVRTPSVREI
jgi:predicted regulator of Ras-like GTPase activity (Roadblock/LC7/MglB family)